MEQKVHNLKIYHFEMKQLSFKSPHQFLYKLDEYWREIETELDQKLLIPLTTSSDPSTKAKIIVIVNF